MNEARKKVIDTSYKYIDDLADKYKDEEMVTFVLL